MFGFSRRNRKKTVYAAGLVGVSAAVVLIVSALTRPASAPAQPTPSPTALYAPIVNERVTALPYKHADGRTTVDVVVQLRNPNPRAGVSRYPVDFRILDPSGATLLTHQELAYIPPATLQYVMALGLELSPQQTIGKVEVTLPPSPLFEVLPEQVSTPTFSTFLRTVSERAVGDEIVATQTGLAKNTSTFDWQKVEVAVVGLNANQEVVAAGKTFLGRLLTGEQREFSVEWPKPREAIVHVIALPSTNVFREENVVEIEGDPSRLR